MSEAAVNEVISLTETCQRMHARIEELEKDVESKSAAVREVDRLTEDRLRLFTVIAGLNETVESANFAAKNHYDKILKNNEEAQQRIAAITSANADLRAHVAEVERRGKWMEELLNEFIRHSEVVAGYAGSQWADENNLCQETHWLNVTRNNAIKLLHPSAKEST